jgi:hypothetical protein
MYIHAVACRSFGHAILESHWMTSAFSCVIINFQYFSSVRNPGNGGNMTSRLLLFLLVDARQARRAVYVTVKCLPVRPGTDVMILKIFSPKNLSKILAIFSQTAASFLQTFNHNTGF